MAGTDTFLIDSAVRHAIYVNRFAGSQLKQMLPYLERVKRQTAGALAGKELTEFSRTRLNKLYNEINSLTVEIYKKMGKKLKGNMKEFAAYEAEFSKRMLDTAVGIELSIPAASQISAAVFSEPVATLKNTKMDIELILEQFSEKKGKQLITTIQDGVISGKTNSQIVRDMAFVTDTSMANGLESLVRSVTTHTSNVARNELYKENEDVIDGYMWLSTLDDLTCSQCQALDHEEFKTGEGPMPGTDTHFGCRCTTKAMIKPEFKLQGLPDFGRPAVGPDGAERGVSGKTTYGEWLETKPAWFQDDVLGETKGVLFREGGLPVSRFVDENYKPYTIKQLAKVEKETFDRLGLNKSKDEEGYD